MDKIETLDLINDLFATKIHPDLAHQIVIPEGKLEFPDDYLCDDLAQTIVDGTNFLVDCETSDVFVDSTADAMMMVRGGPEFSQHTLLP